MVRWSICIARITRPSLASDALVSFDLKVRHFLQSLMFLTVPAWSQAQLCLKCGGIGLHSASYHAAAAFISSLTSSPGFGSAEDYQLQQGIATCNSQVSVPTAITVESLPLPLLLHRRSCQEKLKNNYFNHCWSPPPQLKRHASCQCLLLMQPLGCQ